MPAAFPSLISYLLDAASNQSSVWHPPSASPPCSIVRDGLRALNLGFEFAFLISFSWCFFCALLFGFGLSPFTEEAREGRAASGRNLRRAPRPAPCRSRAGGGRETEPTQRRALAKKHLK